MKKEPQEKRIPIYGNKNPEMPISRFRRYWLKAGYELVDITSLCDFKLGDSGWCNDFNEPDENIYHIQILYRDESIGSFPNPNKNLDDRFVVFVTNEKDITGADFTIFRKVRV